MDRLTYEDLQTLYNAVTFCKKNTIVLDSWDLSNIIYKIEEILKEERGDNITLHTWDSLYKRATDKTCNSDEMKAKDNARSWFETRFTYLKESEVPEEEIDSICIYWRENLNKEPCFDKNGNYVCNIKADLLRR